MSALAFLLLGVGLGVLLRWLWEAVERDDAAAIDAPPLNED